MRMIEKTDNSHVEKEEKEGGRKRQLIHESKTLIFISHLNHIFV